MIVGSRGDIANFKGVQPSARASSHVLPGLLYQKSHDLGAFGGVYGIRYNGAMKYIVMQTEDFSAWLLALWDLRAQAAIGRRIDQAQAGNPAILVKLSLFLTAFPQTGHTILTQFHQNCWNLGDVKPVGSGVSEMRIDVGAGYRLYFTLRNRTMVLLLVGGDKSTQQTDIRKAIDLAKEI